MNYLVQLIPFDLFYAINNRSFISARIWVRISMEKFLEIIESDLTYCRVINAEASQTHSSVFVVIMESQSSATQSRFVAALAFHKVPTP